MTTDTEIVEIVLVHPELVLTPTIEAVPAMETELEYQIIVGPDTYDLFFHASGGDFEDFDAALGDDPTVRSSEVIIDGEDFRVYRMRLSSTERLVLPEAARLGMRILHAVSGDGGWVATLEVPERAALHRFRSHCVERDVAFRVKRLFQSPSTGEGRAYGLTDSQRETLETAHRMGYFADPRDASLEDVATAIGVSPSAASGRLRRGLDALLENTLATRS